MASALTWDITQTISSNACIPTMHIGTRDLYNFDGTFSDLDLD